MSISLSRALRVESGTRLAVVGAGGKTSAIFQIARQLEGKVLISATTHLSPDQVLLGDRHFELGEGCSLIDVEQEMAAGINVLTGPLIPAEDRVQGLSAGAMDALHSFGLEKGYPLLIEADGSRCKPLKAPAEHEPAIPTWATTVLVVAGLSVLGRTLDADNVHRPEIFSALTGLGLGEEVTATAIVRMLKHPNGGLKNIPFSARRVALLNQADHPDLISTGRTMSDELLESYHSVLVGSLLSENQASKLRVAMKVAGIILAAGSSERYGQPKQLLDFHGMPFIRRVVLNAMESGLSPVTVVTGAVTLPIFQALEGLPVEYVHNSNWYEGQSSSVRIALQSLPNTVEAAMFLLSDQPQLPAGHIQQIMERYFQTQAPAVVPFILGRRGNPVLFDRSTFEPLISLKGDSGGRQLLNSLEFERVDWAEEWLGWDVDTPHDYQRLINNTSSIEE